ncbi:hypothetical protein JTE90_013238 [Oedothorax gibbosus]|uniref:Uncharacterized protein n=1 Tax=Oedothorax gibbosus TaxID=931172 RepID=A0AAV6VE61_9ARAC|nr:hypothetical protein JTE90_013238 [Oedothorax gibbosus]
MFCFLILHIFNIKRLYWGQTKDVFQKAGVAASCFYLAEHQQDLLEHSINEQSNIPIKESHERNPGKGNKAIVE